MRNYTTWRENEMGSNCPLQLADKNRLQQSVCCIYVEYRDPEMTDTGSICDVCHSMAWCMLFRYGFGRTLQSEGASHATSNGAVCTSLGVTGSQSLSLLRCTPCRQSMVLLVGEYLYSPVKPFSGIPDPASGATSQTVKKSLRTYNGVGYVNYAPHKTGAGRGNPKNSMATQTPKASFFVSCLRISIASSEISDVSMVTLAGLPQGRPVSIEAGISTPVNVTALFERGNSGGDSSNSMEVAAMATTPGRSHPDTVKKSLPVSRFRRYIPAAGVNPPAGFSSLNINADSRDNSVTRSFCVRKATCTRLMAGRNGGAFALAGFVDASLLTLLRLATPFSSALARFEKPINEAVTMVNANPCPYPLFIWLFAAVSRADLPDYTPHMVRITAPDELTARRSLVGRYALSFAGRIPAQEVHHA